MNSYALETIYIPAGEFIRGETLEECDETYESPRSTLR